jgi:hypothetical protein
MNGAEIKAYQEKVRAQLQEAKAVLNGFEAHAKGKLAQSEIDTITRLKAKNQEIDNKVHHDLKAAGAVAVAEKIKSDNSPEPLHVQARKAVELLNGRAALRQYPGFPSWDRRDPANDARVRNDRSPNGSAYSALAWRSFTCRAGPRRVAVRGEKTHPRDECC